jgi:hypothetical protein
MDTYAIAPDSKGGFLALVTQSNGGVIVHRFDSESEAVAWVMERRQLVLTNERFQTRPLTCKAASRAQPADSSAECSPPLTPDLS